MRSNGGKWSALESDGSSPHRCRAVAVQKRQTPTTEQDQIKALKDLTAAIQVLAVP
jgi:hypothetical protein